MSKWPSQSGQQFFAIETELKKNHEFSTSMVRYVSGNPRKYALIPLDIVAENMTLDGLVMAAGRTES